MRLETMIILNNSKFAETNDEFINELFSTTTCAGYAKKHKKSITLMNMQKQKIGVINARGVLCSARKVDGGFWYTHATIKEIGVYDSFTKSIEEPKKLIDSLQAN